MADGAESVSIVQERKRHHRQTCGCTRASAYIDAYKSLMVGGMILRRNWNLFVCSKFAPLNNVFTEK